MNKIALVLVLGFLSNISSDAQSAPPLTLRQTIPLPGVTGKFDHFAFDPAAKRLFAAATGNHSVEVIDLTTGKVQQSIGGLGKPHGLAWVASTNSLYVADGTLAQLLVYKSSSGSQLELAGKLKLSDDADDMVYNEAKHLLFIGHGGSDAANPARVAVVDIADLRLVANIPVATHPEALEIDPQGQRIFANIAESSEIAVIDGSGKAITDQWKLTKAADNVPLAFDAEHHTIYVACRKPATLIAVDAVSGKEISSVSTGSGADDLFYDPASRRIYVICGAGEVDVYQVDSQEALQPLGIIPTVDGAKTALFVPFQSLLYVGVPGADGHAAEIRIYSAVSARGNQ
jgi:DNA-binding beta-propeller fold protein YncE